MALELKLTVEAETRQAEQALARVDKSVEKVTDTAKAADAKLDAAFKNLDKNLKDVETSTKKMGTSQDALTGAIMRFASGVAIGAAIKSTMEYADQIKNMAARAQITTTAMQKLAGAAEDNSSSITAVTNGMAELQRRLQSADGGTIAALSRIGIQFDTIKRLSPDQAFLAVAGAMERSNTKARDANEIFGRMGRDLLPALNAEFVKSADNQLAMSEAAVKAAADMNGNWNKAWRDMKTIGGEALGGIGAQLNGIYGTLTKALPFAQELARVFGRDAARGGLTTGLYSMLRTGINPNAFAATMTSQALTTLPAGPTGAPQIGIGAGASLGAFSADHALELLTAQVTQNVDGLRILRGSTGRAAAALDRMAATAADLLNRQGYFTEFLRTGSLGVDIRRGEIISRDLPNPWGGVGFTAPGGGSSNFSAFAPGAGWGPDWRNIGRGLPGVVTGAIQGGGNIAGSIGSYLGGSMLSGLGDKLGASLTKSLGGGMLGNMLGGIVGSAIPLVGSLLGGLVGKLFGPSRGAILGKEADARMDQTRAGLLDQFGSLDAIRASGPVGSALADAWGSKNVQGEAWFNTLTKAFQEQNQILAEQKAIQAEITSLEEQRAAIAESLIPTWAQVSEIIARYQIAEGSLGTQINQLATTEGFKQILNDIEALIRAGGDMGGILFGMKEEIAKLVQESIKFGTTIPENMRPYIEELIRAGLLLDENGEAITDLGQIKWGAAVKSQADIANEAMAKIDEAIEKLKTTFDELAQKIADIMDRLANGLPAAAAAGAAGASQYVSGIEPPTPGGDRGIEGFASGSGGIRDFGRGTLAVLHGREAVLTERQLRAVSRGGGGVTVVQVVLDGRVVAESTARHLPDLMPAFGV